MVNPNTRWRAVGWLGIVAAVLVVAGFFLPWITLDISGTTSHALAREYNIDPPFLNSEFSAWSLTFYSVASAPGIVGNDIKEVSDVREELPDALDFTLIVLFVLFILIIIVPVSGSLVGLYGYRLVDSDYDGRDPEKLHKKMKLIAFIGAVPAVVLFLVIQGALGFSLEFLNEYDSVDLNMGIHAIGIGFWMALAGFAIVIVMSRLIRPRPEQPAAAQVADPLGNQHAPHGRAPVTSNAAPEGPVLPDADETIVMTRDDQASNGND